MSDGKRRVFPALIEDQDLRLGEVTGGQGFQTSGQKLGAIGGGDQDGDPGDLHSALHGHFITPASGKKAGRRAFRTPRQ